MSSREAFQYPCTSNSFDLLDWDPVGADLRVQFECWISYATAGVLYITGKTRSLLVEGHRPNLDINTLALCK
jgi:hypothetical protein